MLRATDYMMTGTLISSLSYFFIGFPFAMILGFLTKLGFIGIWIGILCATLSILIWNEIAIRRMNLTVVVKQAQQRMANDG
jgi:Na+-driven multidrug efflux pump